MVRPFFRRASEGQAVTMRIAQQRRSAPGRRFRDAGETRLPVEPGRDGIFSVPHPCDSGMFRLSGAAESTGGVVRKQRKRGRERTRDPFVFRLSIDQATATRTLRRRRIDAPAMPKPAIIRPHAAGSGTAAKL